MSPSLTDVFIADDHHIFRQGVKTALAPYCHQGVRVVGEAATGSELLRAIESSPPHVVLMDIQMPEMDGVQATALVKKRCPGIRVIGLSFDSESDAVLAMVNAGCNGYLLKDVTPEELIHAIQIVREGGTYFADKVFAHLSDKVRKAHLQAERPLTPREAEILKMVCDGASSKEIAGMLHISKRTVDTSRENIMRKAGVKNALALLKYAIKKRFYKP